MAGTKRRHVDSEEGGGQPAEPRTVPEEWPSSEYELLDFGAGRKLERFGAAVLDRVSPAAERAFKQGPELWQQASLQLDAKGKPIGGTALKNPWVVKFGSLKFQLALTPFGHVGLFPEQATNWYWLYTEVRRRALLAANPQDSENGADANRRPGAGVQALNLFAYTGGSTLALAAAGASVVHVDASAPSVQWARRNAESSLLNDYPIRWIVDDARKFVRRELRRKREYDIIVLDPPSYGHGADGKRWEISKHLPDLLRDCGRLLRPGGVVLFTAHCVEPNARSVSAMLTSAIRNTRVADHRLVLVENSGRSLDAGFCVRAHDASV